MKTRHYHPANDHLRVATATPKVKVGDIHANVQAIKDLYVQAVKKKVALVVFPELSLTGYTIQDLVASPALLRDAKEGLLELAQTATNTAMIVGLPLQVGNGLYNCAAILAHGNVLGIVPKTNLPTYNEFYEKRWYQSWRTRKNQTITLHETPVTFGTEQLFDIAGQLVGVEICEDLWVPEQPSTRLAAHGATIIANPSASPELVTKAQYRRELVSQTAARNLVGYVYASADQTESTAEVVMSGHALISEMGSLLAERKPLSAHDRLMIADIDTQHITRDRLKSTDFPNKEPYTITQSGVTAVQTDLMRSVAPQPFTPTGSNEMITERLDTILNIQATGLAMRLRSASIKKVVLGLSGGLDSTLALLVAVRAAEILGTKPGSLIHTLTMPGVASTQRTQGNAVKLAEALAIPNEEIPIATLSEAQLAAIKHEGGEDVTFENTQARIRQALVFNKANQIQGLALGTGDMSEIALGWCTYNGDHMSHYNVNASIPKTLVRSLVRHATKTLTQKAADIVNDILDTPVSPELTGDGGAISQATEDIIGPYELHDFFLYHFLRWLEPEEKIQHLAEQAFADTYTPAEIARWLQVFMRRFYQNQWKRQAMPDGAKVGLSLSPKGDWRMAAEAVY